MRLRSIWLTALSLCLVATPMLAQDEAVQQDEKMYRLKGVLGGGYSHDLSPFQDIANDLTLNRNQFSVFGRFMWQPGNLLSGGLEVGYMNFYSLKSNTGGQAVRTAVPIYFVFSMTAWDRADFTVGYGLGLLSSVITGAEGGVIESSTLSTTVYGSAAYRHPISKNLDLGGEVRYSIFDYLDDKTLSVSILFTYTFHDY